MNQHASPADQPRRSRLLPVLAAAAVVIAVAALVIAVIALMHGGSDNDAPSYSAAQRSADTRAVCDAFTLNRRGVSTQTGITPPQGASDRAAADANARLALFAAAVNLTDALDAAPAAPDDLRTAVTDLAAQYRTVATQYLAGAGTNSPAVTGAVGSAGTAATAVTKACGQ